MSKTEGGEFLVEAHVDDSLSDDYTVNLLIHNNGGEIEHDGQCDDCGKHFVTAKFPDRLGAEKAVEALNGVGIEANLYPDEDDGPSDYQWGWHTGRENLLWEIAHDVQRAEAHFLHAKAVANS